MRIVSGEFGGKKLAAPSNNAIRPTSDRVRESLFNILEHHKEIPSYADKRALDLFAGTGALGLEALSRGAGYCLFIEQDAEARGLVRENIEALNLTGRSRIFRRDATNLGASGTCGRFSLVFADPPYNKGLGEQAFKAAIEGDWLEPEAILILEENAKAEITPPAKLEQIDQRIYGDTQIIIFKYVG